MDDLISRQAAIDAIEKLRIPEDMCVFEILSHIELAIGTLPSAQPEVLACGHGELIAQPERKTGRWIDIDSETCTWKIRCDKCGNERSMMSTQGRYPKFCEGCGAKMEVEHGH